MKHIQKMVLVPQEMLIDKHENTQKLGLAKQLEEFTTELTKILNSTHANPEEQFKIYTQLFTRFLNMDTEMKQPIKVLLQQEPEKTAEPANLDMPFDWNNLLNGIPKNKRSKAAMFINEVKKNKNLNVNENGELVVNGENFVGSNIVDIIHDFMRQRKTMKPVHGSIELAKVLAQSNIPHVYIGNPDRLKLLYKEENDKEKSFNVDSNLDDGWFDTIEAPATIRKRRKSEDNTVVDKRTPRILYKKGSKDRERYIYEGL